MSCTDLFRDMTVRADAVLRQANGATADARSPHITAATSARLQERAACKFDHAAELRAFAARLPR